MPRKRINIQRKRYASGAAREAVPDNTTELKMKTDAFIITESVEDRLTNAEIEQIMLNYLEGTAYNNKMKIPLSEQGNLFHKILSDCRIASESMPKALVFFCDYFGTEYVKLLSVLPDFLSESVFKALELRFGVTKKDFLAALQSQDTGKNPELHGVSLF